jgi:hypothetical protein
MKLKLKYFFLELVVLFISESFYAQNTKELTISFNDISFKEILVELEAKTDYTFYYQEGWFTDKHITKSYTSIKLKEILDDLFKSTPLNYIIHNKRIILTKNSVIYSDLPINFFSKNNQIESNVKTPILLKDYISRNTDKYITIGKERKNNKQKLFTISGVIKTVSSNKPLKNVKVYIDKTNNYTMTNAKGFYKLMLEPGSYKIITELMGYENTKKNILVFGSGSLDLGVEDEIVALGEVIINSSKEESVKKSAIGLIKVDVKGVKRIPTLLGERDLLKVVTNMPGVKTAGEGSLGYNVRGGKSDQNLILLDNAILYNPSHFFGFFSALNPYSTGDVDVYKGNIPSEYGGRLSSVFDISTKEVNMTKVVGEGNVGPVTGNLMIELPIIKEKAGLLVGLRSTYSDWLLKTIKSESIKNSEASFFDGIVKFDSKLGNNDKLKATAYYSKDQFSISSDSLYKYSNQLASIEWNHKFDKKNKSTLQLNKSQYNFNIIYNSIFNNNFDLGFVLNETQLKFKLNYLLSDAHKFNYGISSKLYNISPGDLNPFDEKSLVQAKSIENEKALESAIFISDLFKVNDRLLFDIGFRYSFYASLGEGTQNIYNPDLPFSEDSIDETIHYANNEIIKSYGYPELRISTRYLLSPSFSIKGGYNRTVQYIHMLSANTTASPVDTWKLSNLNIKPQESDQFSVGLFKNFNDNIYELSLETYYKKTKNNLDFKTGAELILNENIETQVLTGEGKAYGVEFLLKKKEGKLNGWLSYSYTKSFLRLKSDFLTNQVNRGNFFPSNYDKPHDVSLIANYKFTHRYSFSFNFVYQTGRPITYPIGKYNFGGVEHVLYSDRNQFRIPDYYRFDIGVNIEGNHKIKKLAHSFWNISVYNVLGRNNPYSIFFVNEDGNIKAYKTSIFAIPIPTITYNFKF